jgi:hypothetical protein
MRWVVVEEFPNYEINENGDVRVIKTGIYKTQAFLSKEHDYKVVWLWKKNKSYKRSVHRLVAQAFIPNPKKKSQVNHKDGIKSNNHVSNLEWATPQENIKHAWDSGLIRTKGLNKNNTGKDRNRVLQYSKKGVFIKEYSSITTAAEESFVKADGIRNCCNGKLKTSGGYIWRYKDVT